MIMRMRRFLGFLVPHRHRYAKVAFPKGGPCAYVWRCTRCNWRDPSGFDSPWLEDHDWPEWAPVAAGVCDMERVCRRCGKTTQETRHDWSRWEPAVEGKCDMTRTCGRCGKTEQDLQHDLTNWSAGERSCKRCGLTEKCCHHMVASPTPGWDECTTCGYEVYVSEMG